MVEYLFDFWSWDGRIVVCFFVVVVCFLGVVEYCLFSSGGRIVVCFLWGGRIVVCFLGVVE